MNTKRFAISRVTLVRPKVLWLLLGLVCVGLLSSCRGVAQPAQTAPKNEPSLPIRVSNSGYLAAFDSAGVRFTPAQGPTWHWQLLSIGTADAPLAGVATAEIAPHLAAAGIVVYPRGLLAEQYLEFSTHIEQQFILPNSLALNGADLIISGQVFSTGVFETASQGWLWRAENGVVSLGQVTVYDARGVQIPAEMQVSAETIELRVDGSALAAAAYPVTIDPEIGSDDFRVSYSSDDTNIEIDAFDPAAAYNPINDEFLVVWAGDLFPAGATDTLRIYARRIRAADGSFAADTVMLPGSTFNTTPAVAFNATDGVYLVVFTCGNAFDKNTANLCAARLDAAAAPIGIPFQVNTLANALHPAVTYNPTSGEFLVVWAGNRNLGGAPDEFEIFGQRVATDGSLSGSNFRISEMGIEDDTNYRAQHPAVAYNVNTNQYLVVWSGDDDTAPLIQGEKEIFGQLLDSGGTQVGSDFRISDMGPDGSTLYGAYLPDVVYNPQNSEYLVVWMADDDTAPLVEGEFEIFAQRLTGAGAEVGRHNFQVSQMGAAGNVNFAAYRPRLAYNPQDARYMLVWRGGDNTDGQVSGEFEIFQQAIYGDPTLGDKFRETTRLSRMGGLGNPAYLADKPVIAYSSTANNYLIAWQGENNIGSLVDGKVEIFSQQYAGAPLRCFIESNGDNVTDYSGSSAEILQTAINAASSGDTLKIAGDCIGVQSTGSTTQTVYIDKSIYLQGGYVAPDLTAANWLTVADSASYPTTLDAKGLGRVIYVTNSATVTLANLTLTGGRDTSSECSAHSCGGGLKVDAGATVTLSHSMVQNNTAYYGGGIFSYGTLNIAHSTIANNVADSWDGGIYSSGSLTIENSTISGNTATSGNVGGLASVGSLTMTNSTIFGNTAALDTGGFRQQSSAASLYNTLIANNSGLDCSLTSGASLAANVHNFIEDGTCSPYLSGAPAISALADNGGETQTHALQYNSPAIDAGDPATCPTTDQRGQPRNDLGCDIGAFEARLSDLTTVSKIVSGAGTYTFGPTLAKIEVVNTGGCLTGLQVQRVAGNHPNATANLQTGTYWVITPTGCTSGFNVTLTLPAVTPDENDKLCRYTGSGTVWDCAASGFDANTLTRANVTAFSDWTVGDDSGPTAVTLTSFAVRGASFGSALWLIALLLLPLFFWAIRKKVITA